MSVSVISDITLPIKNQEKWSIATGFIAVEKLKVQKMQKNGRLSKSIADAAWSLFRHCLEYKAEEAGIGFKAVKPEYTSQDCSACGHREKKKLSDSCASLQTVWLYSRQRPQCCDKHIDVGATTSGGLTAKKPNSQRALSLGVVTLYQLSVPLSSPKTRGEKREVYPLSRPAS